MTRAITPEQFVEALPAIVDSMGEDSFLIERDGELVAALVTPEEYEFVRKARGERAIAAMKVLSDAIYAQNPSEEELRELEKALDRKA